MRRWKPKPSSRRWVALALLVAALAAAGFLAAQLVGVLAEPPASWPINPTLFGRVLLLVGVLAVAGLLAYRVGSALTLGYELDRNGLYIVWLGNRAIVPLEQIQTVDVGVRGARLPRVPGLAYVRGQGRTADGRRLHLFATQSPERCLVVYTPAEAYAISPADVEAFVQDLEQRRNLGATKPLAATFEPSRMFLYDFWNDRPVRTMLLLAFALNLLVLGFLSLRYPSLAPMLQMRFDAAGQAADLRPRHQVLFLPLAAFALSLLNVVLGLMLYRRQQLGVRLLQGASVIVQILFGIATITIIR